MTPRTAARLTLGDWLGLSLFALPMAVALIHHLAGGI